ncbi:MAG: murein biosynthesis integral membrane protein MurJ [Opitutales bacterium]
MSDQAQPNIVASSLKVTIIKMAGSLAGFIAILLIARKYGSNDVTDAFFIGRLLPIIIAAQIARALSISLVPVFTRIHSNEGEQACRKAVRSTITAVGGLLLIFTALFAVCSPTILHFQAPGFDEEQYASAFKIAMTVLPLYFLLGTNSVIESYLNLKHIFLPAELASALTSFGTIVGIVFLSPLMGLQGVAVGTSTGALLGFLLLNFFAIRRFKLLPSLDPRLGFRTLKGGYKALMSIFYGVSAGQAAMIIAQAFATTLGDGKVTIFNYSVRLVTGFPFMGGMALGKVLMPKLSKEADADDPSVLRASVTMILRGILFIFLPYTVAFFLFRDVVVDILFSGGMDAENLSALSMTLAFHSPAILSGAANIILLRTFHSLNESTIIFRSSTVFLVVNLATIYFLSYLAGFGVAGLGGAYSVATTFQMFGLMYLLSKRIGIFIDRPFFVFLGKVLLGMALASIPVWFLLPSDLFSTNSLSEWAFAAIAFVAMSVVGIAALSVLRVAEMQKITQIFARKFLRRMAS